MKILKYMIFCMLLIVCFNTYSQNGEVERLKAKINALNASNEILTKKLEELHILFKDSIARQNQELIKIYSELQSVNTEINKTSIELNQSMTNVQETQKIQSNRSFVMQVILICIVLALMAFVIIFFFLKWKKLAEIAKNYSYNAKQDTLPIDNSEHFRILSKEILELKSSVMQQIQDSKMLTLSKLDETKLALTSDDSSVKGQISNVLQQNSQTILQEFNSTREFMLKLLSNNNIAVLEEFNTTKDLLLKILNQNVTTLIDEMNATKDFVIKMTAKNNNGLVKDFEENREFLIGLIRKYHQTLVEEFEVTKEIVLKKVTDVDKLIDKETQRTLDIMDKEIREVKKQVDKEIRYIREDFIDSERSDR